MNWTLGTLDAASDAAPPAETEHHGQVRIAYRLADAYQGRLLHVHGVGWHHWDGARWAEDHHGHAKRAVLDVLRAALADSLDDTGLRADVRKCETASGVVGVLDLAAALTEFAATVNDLDADPYLLNTATGTLDLRTGQQRPHDPADRITKVTVAGYCAATCAPSAWTGFLERILPDPEVRGFLQRVVGVALLGKVLEHVLPIATGAGANGKSTLMNALRTALGDYAGAVDPELFLAREGAHPTGEFDLRGLRFAIVSETDRGRRLAEATMKRLTGGDPIKARRMRQDFVEFDPSHLAVLVTNQLPRVSGDDPAIWRRIRVVPFDVVIPEDERDERLGERLDLDADNILAWAVEGYRDYVQHGGLDAPKAVTVATDEYRAASDAIGRFIEEACLINPHMFVGVAELFEAWCAWRADDGAEEISKRAFGIAMDDRGFPAEKGSKGRRIRRGIALAAPDCGGED